MISNAKLEPVTNRRRLFGIVAIALVAVTVAYLGFGIIDPANLSPPDEPAQDPSENRLIEPTENGTQLWPYTSRAETTTERTLAANLLIKGDPDDVRTTLSDRTEFGFEELPEDQEDAEGDTYQIEIEENSINWHSAHGSTRYTYVETEDGGQWLDESYQLHSGEYLGIRYHIRAYDDPEGEWTSIQIHDEYFDMFRLRHTVTGAQGPANQLEREFIDQPFVEDITREHHGLLGGRSDGWMRTVELTFLQLPLQELFFALALGSFVSPTSRRALTDLAANVIEWSREHWHGFAMAGGLIGLVVGIRVAGLTLEHAFPDVTPQVFATILYPLLAIGPLVIAAIFARHLPPLTAFGFGTVGFGAALIIEMSQIGLEIIPIQLILHRVGLVFSLGLFALGVARKAVDESGEEIDIERISLATLGAIAWFVGLAMPLFGYV